MNSKEDYQHALYNLRYNYKCLNEKYANLSKEYNSLKMLSNPDETKAHIDKLKAKIKELESKLNDANISLYRAKQTNERQHKINKKLSEENKHLNLLIGLKTKEITNLSKKILEFKKLKAERDNFKMILNTLTIKNKQVFQSYFDKIDKDDSGLRIHFSTVLTDLEYMFFFQKLFEMHVFDYIVDRQDPDNKTEFDTKELISICKEFTNIVTNSLIYNVTLNIAAFKKSFKAFADRYIEHKYKLSD